MSKNQRKQGNASLGAKFFSGIFFLAGLAILIFIGISLGKEAYKKRQIQNEIDGLQAEIQKVNQQNSDLNNLISYLSTSEFQEKEAREKLNLQKEDEKMIVLRKELGSQNAVPAATPSTASQIVTDHSPNWQKWLKFFFAQKS